jgi:sigma-B regulation protein RsbU (phosphoserine phosphatase)
MAFLQDILRNEKIPLHGTLTIVGRDVTCDIVIDAPTVSSRHFMILNRNGQYSVEDLGSMNGTFVNGHSLTRRIRLFSGDRITLVGLSLIFQDDAEAAVAVSSRRGEETQDPNINIPGTCTIRMSELMDAPHVPELSSLKMDGDLRLSVKPEAKLRAMLEIARSLSHSLELKVVLPQILDALFAIFPAADCGFVLLRNQQSGELTPSAVNIDDREMQNLFRLAEALFSRYLSAEGQF